MGAYEDLCNESAEELEAAHERIEALSRRVAELEGALGLAAERDRALTNQADDWERALRLIGGSPKNIWERDIARKALKGGT